MNRRALLRMLALSALAPIAARGQQVTAPRAGAAGTWRLIGSTQAKHVADHDGIVVVGPNDDFRRIKFKVTGAPLNLHRLVVTYENGGHDEIPARHNIPQGGASRVIDLRGVGKRRIRRIDFWYDTKGLLNREARVTVFGMK